MIYHSVNLFAVVINASIVNSALKYRERCCAWMKDNDYWNEMIDDLLKVLIKTYGIICIVLIIVGLFLKLFEHL